MMINLEPCPFCRGSAEVYTPTIVLGDDDTDVDYMYAHCTRCHVRGPTVRFCDHRRASTDYQAALTKVADHWNTRV